MNENDCIHVLITYRYLFCHAQNSYLLGHIILPFHLVLWE